MADREPVENEAVRGRNSEGKQQLIKGQVTDVIKQQYDEDLLCKKRKIIPARSAAASYLPKQRNKAKPG